MGSRPANTKMSEITELIRKKRDGAELAAGEIASFVRGVLSGEFNEAQTAAFLMAVYFRGLTPQETSALALEMAHSGEMLDLSSIPGTVDKHSTGGVGDKTTLVVAPLVAAAGVPVPKLSGRALGHTSGTVDRLESIPGLSMDLGTARFIDQVQKIGVAVGGQTARLVPADKKIYALRDQTATVEVTSLIAASVMSKKLAGGASAILLDVKCGQGAFISDLTQAKEMAELMVHIGTSAGRKTRALITPMDEPIGRAVGEGIEMAEAIYTLDGEGPADFVELCLLIGSHMVHLGGKADSPEAAREKLQELLESGAAFEKFAEMVAAQGGDVKALDCPEELGQAQHEREITAPQAGFIQQIDAHVIGEVSRILVKHHKGGVLVERKVGEKVEVGEVIARLQTDLPETLEESARRVAAAYQIGAEQPTPRPLLLCPPIG